MSLRLFRRHEARCSLGYKKENRVYEYDGPKTGKRQCQCPIYAEGKLGESYIRPKSTGQRSWEMARTETASWEQANKPQIQSEPEDGGYKLVSVSEAVESFYANTRENGASDDRITSLEHLFTLRLIPFAQGRGIVHMQEMDNAQIWQDFRLSWKNENPFRNKKPEPGMKAQKSLMNSTKARLTSDLRAFISYCESREWLSDNWASRKHKMIASYRTEPKEPFSRQDEQYIYRAWDLVTDGRTHTRTQNGLEDLIFTLCLRYTGLRISDVVALEREQLVPFAFDHWTHAIGCFPKKTRDKDGNFVHIPIPSKAQQAYGDPDLVSALLALPLKHGRYFFLGGGPLPTRDTKEWETRIEQATNNWRGRISRLFCLAGKLMEMDGVCFSVKPHPHRFRHTFAARLLQMGLSLRIVASYLGDTEEVVRKHYAKFCIAEQRQAGSAYGQAMREHAIYCHDAPLCIASATTD